MAIVFDGQKLAQEKEEELKREIEKRGLRLKLAVVLVGENKASILYVQKKKEAAERIGIQFELKKFHAKTSEKEIIDYLQKKNREKETTGLMIQLPLPKNFDELKIRRNIHPFKDVDCLHPKNLGMLMLGRPIFYPAVVKAVLAILQTAVKGKLIGKRIVIIGASNLVGKPLSLVLKNLGATVVVCDEYTQNLSKWTQKAEILISATGMPGLIKKEMVKKNAVVIDVGETKGDVDSEVAQVASFVTPVPGGVGPLTVVSLLENMVKSTSW